MTLICSIDKRTLIFHYELFICIRLLNVEKLGKKAWLYIIYVYSHQFVTYRLCNTIILMLPHIECHLSLVHIEIMKSNHQSDRQIGLYTLIYNVNDADKNIVKSYVKRALQYIPRNMHTVFALLCFVVVIHWLIFPYPSGLLHWHCGNLTIAPVPAKQPWWIWINTSCEFIMNDCITTTKQSTTKPCAYFLGYTVCDKSFM